MSVKMDLTAMSAGELAAAIASGLISSQEAVDAHIARIEEVDGVLNAVVAQRFTDAREEARAADRVQERGDVLGSLHGLPVTIKDQFDVTGLPTTFGVTRLGERPLERDGAMVASWRAAGAVVLAKSNVPQGLGVYETVNDAFGRTNNPWDLSRTPGGSSGGEAALVASGASPLGLAADFGGSLRVPAAWCGLCTIKPTARRLPLDLAPVRTASGMEGVVGQPGPLARRVADVSLGLEVMVRSLISSARSTNPPVPWRAPDEVDPSALRVAVLEEIDGYRPAPAIRRALRETADALRSAGVAVEPWVGAPDTTRGADLIMRLFSADGFAFARQVIGDDDPHAIVRPDLQMMSLPRPVLRLIARGMRLTGQRRSASMLANLGRTSAEGLLDLLGDRLAYESGFIAALDDGAYDVVLCPAVPLPAPPHDHTPDIPDAFGSVTLFNLLGLPAGVVPITTVQPNETSDRPDSRERWQQAARAAERDTAGLPVGVQIVARHWREDLVLATMAAIEAGVAGSPHTPTTPLDPRP